MSECHDAAASLAATDPQIAKRQRPGKWPSNHFFRLWPRTAAEPVELSVTEDDNIMHDKILGGKKG